MQADLQRPEYKDLALVGYTLAFLIFKRKHPEDLDWLERSFKGMHDLLHESPLYQIILQEGSEAALHQAIVNLVQARFPGLESLAAQQVAATKNIAHLHRFLVKIGTASDAKAAQSLLLGLPQEEPQENG
jgi:hypothetical protein